jgi:tyrosyl-tRNA synthetase
MIKPADQLQRIRSGAVDVLPEQELIEKLGKGKPLRIKFGADPSAPDLHLGHCVALMKLREFQDLGHTVIFLIGDFTGMIGDPTGRADGRKPLAREQVRANAVSYENQVFKLLDRNKTEVRFNSEWMDTMSASDIVKLCAQWNVARMLERDDFAKRYAEQRSIGIHEFLYPLIQAYDSVALHADVEVGGTDQRFNLLLGREIQKAYGLEPQVIVTLPLLEGIDGRQKMSKSLGNAIGIAEEPAEIFGKVMSISDVLMMRYFALLRVPDGASLRSSIERGATHPMDAKKELARSLVERFWGAEAAQEALQQFERRYQQRLLPEEVPQFEWPAPVSASISLAQAMKETGLAKSTSEARRLIAQGAVRVDGRRTTDIHYGISSVCGAVLIEVGSRKICRVIFPDSVKKGG